MDRTLWDSMSSERPPSQRLFLSLTKPDCPLGLLLLYYFASFCLPHLKNPPGATAQFCHRLGSQWRRGAGAEEHGGLSRLKNLLSSERNSFEMIWRGDLTEIQ